MARIIDTLRYHYTTGSMLIKLIFINVGVFMLLRVGALVCALSGISDAWFLHWVELPSSPALLVRMPWTLLTYMFAQYDALHILFNMLWFYWFGQIFMLTDTSRRMVALYIYGGIAGAALFMAAYNLLPAFHGTMGWLIGSSASVIAIVTATAIAHPDYKVGLLFFGEVSLKWIAIVTIGIDLLSIGGSNAGGHVAHLGGAAMGALYGYMLNNERDITKPFNKLMDTIANALKAISTPRHHPNGSRHGGPTSSHKASYGSKNASSSNAKAESTLDEILDKIKKSGYTSLTADEKRRLFEASKNLGK
ncbi:MAG: rhomboid family intramembrane serine protease [Pseudoflavonifractor sp.]|nr:rhomboid family intramembrane serine protease [Pseudoflavonifractor sp.]